LLRATNPVVATYARNEAVDVRISARPADGRPAAALADDAEAVITELLGEHVWARGDTTWAGAIEQALVARSWTLATTERGSDGALVQLLRGVSSVVLAERRAADGPGERWSTDPEAAAAHEHIRSEAARVRAASAADVGLAILSTPRGEDTVVHVGIASPAGEHAETRFAFLRGNLGADRAAIAGAAALLAFLRGIAPG
jgi:hypothetical protein